MITTPLTGPHTDLTGIWSGEFWYDEAPGDVGVFVANIAEAGGHIEGTTLERASFDELTGELTATVAGERTGSRVSFTKLYDEASGAHQMPIDYIGDASADLTSIVEYWILFEPEAWSGGFRMQRAVSASREVEVTSAHIGVTIDRRR